MIADLRFAVRSLRKEKGAALTVALTLAVCIAANTAMFAIVNSVLLKPLPAPDADRIVILSNRYPKAGVVDFYFSSAGDYYDRRAGVPALEEHAMFRFTDAAIGIEGAPEQVPGMSATPSLFRLLRAAPLRGRLFQDAEGEIGADRKVILSYGLWQRLYGGSPDAVGRELRMNGHPYAVVGVMPASFTFLRPDVRFWVPLAFTAEDKTAHHSNNFYSIGRLRPGAGLPQVQAQVDTVNARNLDRFPEMRQVIINAGFHTVVEPLQDMLTRGVRRSLYLLWGGAVLVLLIGAANIANLSLARLAARRRELATRLALGAGRMQLLRQFVVESMLLALTGAAAGVALGAAMVRALALVGLDQFPRASEVAVDGRVILVAIALAAATGIAVGLMPLGDVFRIDLNRTLREASRADTAARGARRLERGLVGAQIGLAFSLLMAAALLLTSFRQLLNADPGFRTKDVLTASMALPSSNYSGDPQTRGFMLRALDAIRGTRGVIAAGAASSVPLSGDYSDSVIIAEDYVMKPGESVISPRRAAVTPGYFESMGIPLVRGRYFDDRDHENAPGAVIIDQRLAQRFWGRRNPIGQRMFQPSSPADVLHSDKNTRWLYVVGVVRSVHLDDLAGTGSPAGMYYLPWAQYPDRSFTFTIRTAGDPSRAVREVRAAVAGVDRELPVFDIHTMQERAELTLASRRTAMLLAAAFGAVALFLSAIGIYGVLAYLVTQRRREIGIRVALGSTQGGIVRLVLREGMVLAGVGLAAGLAVAAASGRALATELYGVRPFDPVVMAGVVGLLGAVALAASITPALRALRVDPMVVLSEQ